MYTCFIIIYQRCISRYVRVSLKDFLFIELGVFPFFPVNEYSVRLSE